MTLVSDMFRDSGVNRGDVELVQSTGGYWERACRFALSVWERDLEDLTPKQIDWLTNIHDDIVEKKKNGF